MPGSADRSVGARSGVARASSTVLQNQRSGPPDRGTRRVGSATDAIRTPPRKRRAVVGFRDRAGRAAHGVVPCAIGRRRGTGLLAKPPSKRRGCAKPESTRHFLDQRHIGASVEQYCGAGKRQARLPPPEGLMMGRVDRARQGCRAHRASSGHGAPRQERPARQDIFSDGEHRRAAVRQSTVDYRCSIRQQPHQHSGRRG